MLYNPACLRLDFGLSLSASIQAGAQPKLTERKSSNTSCPNPVRRPSNRCARNQIFMNAASPNQAVTAKRLRSQTINSKNYRSKQHLYILQSSSFCREHFECPQVEQFEVSIGGYQQFRTTLVLNTDGTLRGEKIPHGSRSGVVQK